ncbi:hypothetical protein [Ilumatobacter coccineus]|nr:hypothetical protein [Ilumatobacter coccineus]
MLADKIVALHESLATAELPHAFGGALALAWCTERARGTIDIDVNVFAPVDRTDELIAALPSDVSVSDDERALLVRDGQVRLWWDATPVDVFLDTTDFHVTVGERVRWEDFAGASIPFLSCRDLAVFKTFFDRTKDWADLEEMAKAGTLDVEAVAGVLAVYLGPDDHRIARLVELARGDVARGDVGRG